MRHGSLAILAWTIVLLASPVGSTDFPIDTPPSATPDTALPEVPPPTPGETSNPTTELFVLGDSLSDVGNAAAVSDYLLGQTIAPPTVGLCNPTDVLLSEAECGDVFDGRSRVTDGEVAVEHLARHLGVAPLAPSLHVIPSGPGSGTDYAVASAKASGPGIEDLSHQVDRLLLDRAPLSADAVYVVMIGGNDAIDALQAAATSPTLSAAAVAFAVAKIVANVERLLDFGARRVVIANVPDLASLPAVRSHAAADAAGERLLARASAISEDFDRALRAFVERSAGNPRWGFPAPASLALFDLRAALRLASDEIAAAGGNARDACFDSATYRQSSGAVRLFHAACAPAADGAVHFERFAFWDGIHPTGAAHAIVGAALVAAVDATLPAP